VLIKVVYFHNNSSINQYKNAQVKKLFEYKDLIYLLSAALLIFTLLISKN